MSIQILGGVAKGLKLSTPNNLIRPTSVLLKRRFFDSQQNFEGLEFVDLCAGSGAIGLEALSRGASHVYLNEDNFKVHKCLNENIAKLKTRMNTESLTVSKGSFEKFLKSYEVKENSVLFFDPPYEKLSLYEIFAELFKQFSNARVIIEFCRQKTMEESKFIEIFGKPERSYQQGTSFLYVYDL